MTSKKKENGLSSYEKKIIEFTDKLEPGKWYAINNYVTSKNKYLFMDTVVGLILKNAFKGYDMTLNDDLDSILKMKV